MVRRLPNRIRRSILGGAACEMPDVSRFIPQHQEQRMATYGSKAGEKVEKAMHERKHGTLKSGGSGKKVTSRKQAIAIGLSEAVSYTHLRAHETPEHVVCR